MRAPRTISKWCTMLLAAATIACATAAGPGSGDGTDEEAVRKKTAALQAACIVHLANYRQKRFVRWPDEAFTGPEQPIVIVVIGDDPIGAILQNNTRGKHIDGRAIEIRRLRRLPPADDDAALAAAARRFDACHLVFIDETTGDRFAEIRGWLAERPVLTVSDMPGFARQGGMIEFGVHEDHIVMDINRPATERARLRLSAKLMDLARTVIGTGSNP